MAMSDCGSFDRFDSDTPSQIKYGIRTPGKLNPSKKKGITTYSLIQAYNNYKLELEEKREAYMNHEKKMYERKKHPVKSKDPNQKIINDLTKLLPNKEGYRFLEKQPSFKDANKIAQTINMERGFSKIVDEIFDDGSYVVLGETTIREQSIKPLYFQQDTRTRFLLGRPDYHEEPFSVPISAPVTDTIEIRLCKDNVIGSLQIASKVEAKKDHENLQVFKVGEIDKKPYISRYQYIIDMHQNVTRYDILFDNSKVFTSETLFKLKANPLKNSRVIEFLDKELNLTS